MQKLKVKTILSLKNFFFFFSLDASKKLEICNEILKKIDELYFELQYIKDQIESVGKVNVQILTTKLAAIAEIEKKCELDDVEIEEWKGPNDKVYNVAFDEDFVLDREFNER